MPASIGEDACLIRFAKRYDHHSIDRRRGRCDDGRDCLRRGCTGLIRWRRRDGRRRGFDEDLGDRGNRWLRIDRNCGFEKTHIPGIRRCQDGQGGSCHQRILDPLFERGKIRRWPAGCIQAQLFRLHRERIGRHQVSRPLVRLGQDPHGPGCCCVTFQPFTTRCRGGLPVLAFEQRRDFVLGVLAIRLLGTKPGGDAGFFGNRERTK